MIYTLLLIPLFYIIRGVLFFHFKRTEEKIASLNQGVRVRILNPLSHINEVGTLVEYNSSSEEFRVRLDDGKELDCLLDDIELE